MEQPEIKRNMDFIEMRMGVDAVKMQFKMRDEVKYRLELIVEQRGLSQKRSIIWSALKSGIKWHVGKCGMNTQIQGGGT